MSSTFCPSFHLSSNFFLFFRHKCSLAIFLFSPWFLTDDWLMKLQFGKFLSVDCRLESTDVNQFMVDVRTNLFLTAKQGQKHHIWIVPHNGCGQCVWCSIVWTASEFICGRLSVIFLSQLSISGEKLPRLFTLDEAVKLCETSPLWVNESEKLPFWPMIAILRWVLEYILNFSVCKTAVFAAASLC